MKPTICAAFIFLVGVSYADEKKLPKTSQELIDRLSSWELDLQAEMQARIKQKRKEVLAVLKKNLNEATRGGDLDGAIAIREEIQRLTPKAQASATDAPNRDASLPKTKRQFEKLLTQSRWAYDENADSTEEPIVEHITKTVEFSDDGYAKISQLNVTTKWEMKGTEKLIFRTDNPKWTIEFTYKSAGFWIGKGVGIENGGAIALLVPRSLPSQEANKAE